MRKNNLLLPILLLVLGACEKPEELWPLPPAGDETVSSVDMGTNYDNAIFFTLKTGTTEIRNVYSWHLGFASGSTESDIILNGGNEVQVHYTGDTAFQKNYPVNTSTTWNWDNPDGAKDSAAFTDWQDTTTKITRNKVYVIDLGSKAIPRFKKMKILSISTDSFTIRYANIDGTDEHLTGISKNSHTNYTYFNLESDQVILFEPVDHAWDLLFTRYRHIYYDLEPITPYYVTGALINTKYVTIAETKAFSFEELDLAKATQLALSNKADEIGFDWKFFDLNGTGKYLVDSKKIYIIKDKEGFLYKLKFIDFYDETGAKGVPKFAFQRL